MPFTVSKDKNWTIDAFIKVPFQLVICDELHSNSKLLLMFLINQIGFRSVSNSVIDRCLNIHRSTRARCLTELKELGFISGSDSHIVVSDPVPILNKLRAKRRWLEEQIEEMTSFDKEPLQAAPKQEVKQRDFMQEATDAWNLYRPKDYAKIRRISVPLVKAVDTHMRELGVKAHDYKEFFSILKAGIERSDFWSRTNSNKTLQSITGVGSPTDKKKSNVYSLFNDGIDAPATATSEHERADTVIYPAEYRNVIDEYDAAQTAYSQAYNTRTLSDDHKQYVIRTENALRAIGLDPALFRFKFGIKDWPTDTPEPNSPRIINWTYDDEYNNAY